MSATTKIIKTQPFNLSTPAGTDIWRIPPAHDVFDAPFYPNPLPTYPLKAFQRARISFKLPEVGGLRKFDQAGLLLVLNPPKNAANNNTKTKWLKTGIEFYQNAPYVSTVCTDNWSDWSIVPLPNFPSNSTDTRPAATIEVQRDNGPTGKTLWVYHVLRDGQGKEIERRPLREVAWFFADEDVDAGGGWQIGVGGAVARPTTEGGEGTLEAEFGEGVEVEVLDG